MNNIRVLAQRNLVWQSIDLYIRGVGEGSDPTIRLTDEQAQALLDQLVACGFRPTDSAGQLEATKDHLEDMRVLAFHALGVVRPEWVTSE